MQTTTVSVGLLEACHRFLVQHIDETKEDKSSVASSLVRMLADAAGSVPRWSASLQPLYELANREGRAVVGIDIEATGTDPQTARIAELVLLVIPPGAGKEYKYHWQINPGCPMPAEATAVHGLSDEDLADCRTFAEVAAEVASILYDGQIIVAFNGNHYDVPLLMTELARAGHQWPAPGTLLLDPSVIFRRKERRRLSDAVKIYCYHDGETAHRAEADTYQALAVLAAQLERYPELGAMDAKALDFYCNNEQQRVDYSGKLATNTAGVVVWTFGKNKDRPVIEDAGYCQWVLRGDFPADTKAAVREIMHW